MFYEKIIALARATPWAIAHDKFRVIESFLTRKARGEQIPQHEIEAAKALQKKPRNAPGGVGLVPIMGTLTQRADMFTEFSGGTSTEAIGQQIDEHASNDAVKAIVLDVDSPGGSVYGVAELADKIREVAKSKKVVAVVNSVAASGAYWLAAQASELVVTPGGEVGSIGVYMMHVDESEGLKLTGQKVEYVYAGERKVAGNSYAPLDEMGRDEMQRTVNDYYGKFVKAVARGRGKSVATVENGFGMGGMVRAEQAIAEGMADKIGTLDSVLGRYGLSLSDLVPAAKSDRPEIEIRKRRLKLT